LERSQFKAGPSRPPSLNNQSKMDWRCGSSGRVPAWQVQSPEIQLQSHQKKRKDLKLLQESIGKILEDADIHNYFLI
jgi:hypothetical protein